MRQGEERSGKQRKTLGASENKIMLTTEVIGETPPQDIAATICQLVNLPVRSALSKTAANAGASKLNAITAKLDTLAASQDAADTTDRLAVAGILDAIKNQTNAMQQQALPAPKVTNADAQTYIHERRPDIELDMCVDPMEPKKKGFLTKYPVGAFDFRHSGGGNLPSTETRRKAAHDNLRNERAGTYSAGNRSCMRSHC